MRAAADGRIICDVVRLSRCDLESALAFVDAASSARGTEPFPPDVLESLARLVPGEALGYYEWSLDSHDLPNVAVETPPLPTPPGVAEARSALCSTYPLSIMRLSAARRPCRLSDFTSCRDLHRLEYYDYVLRPFGIEHQLRLFLSAPPGRSRVFYFSRRSVDGDFSDRDSGLLELMRPFLVAIRERFELRAASTSNGVNGLTAREGEILRWVARGKTNREIAGLLVVSAHTVRKHLENIYAKLGVHTRTGAAARAFAPSQLT